MYCSNNNSFFNGVLVGNPKEVIVDKTIKATFLLQVGDEKDFVLIPCELWGSAAENVLNNLKEGSKVWVQATYRTDKWKTKEGEIRTRNYFRVNHFGVAR